MFFWCIFHIQLVSSLLKRNTPRIHKNNFACPKICFSAFLLNYVPKWQCFKIHSYSDIRGNMCWNCYLSPISPYTFICDTYWLLMIKLEIKDFLFIYLHSSLSSHLPRKNFQNRTLSPPLSPPLSPKNLPSSLKVSHP